MEGIDPAVCSEMSSLASGLRGAVAFRLAVKVTAKEVSHTIFTTTLLMIVFTIWVLGTAADPMLRRLDIRLVQTPCRVIQIVGCAKDLSSCLSICPSVSSSFVLPVPTNLLN